jgi:hypothetical protein
MQALQKKTSGTLYASTIRVIYYDFLWNVLPESFQDVDLLSRIHLWFMHDVAQTHFLLAFRTSLNNLFPKQRIGRCGIRAWLASSPDLNPIDFIFGDIWDLPFMLQTSVTYSNCDKEYRMDFRKFIKLLEFSSESGSHCSVVERTALKFDLNTTSTSFNLQKEIMLQKA